MGQATALRSSYVAGVAVIDAPRDASLRVRRRIIVAGVIGTTIEFYDFYIYGTAAVLVFPALFFPAEDPVAAQLSSLVTFGLAFFARPIGAVAFGHFGDRLGRHHTLVWALLVTGMATVLIGCLPTYEAVGVAAPLLLALLRVVQGIGLGGEWSGAALLSVEDAPADQRGLRGSMPQLGIPLGFLLANGVFLVLTAVMPPDPSGAASAFEQWGWRVPFLVSAVLLVVGLLARLQLTETGEFVAVRSSGAVARVPLAQVVRHYPVRIVFGTLASVATYVLFFLMAVFALSYGTAPTEPGPGQKAGLGYDRPMFLGFLLVGIVATGLLIPIAGRLADRFGRRAVLVPVTVAIAVFGLLFQPWFGEAAGTLQVVSFVVAGLALMGLSYGPMGAFLTELFPPSVRYTGSAIVYNVGSVLGASLAPLLALLLWKPDGDIVGVGLYLAGAAVITFASLLLLPETTREDSVE
ncbi:MFS transporter [Microbacterium timonense]|uniref:MFS transporter n=1 Tax=Microbacterium timonense TaxID=2086576 RepID=UPI000D0FCB62|nr:MFS transporter [Microbacterium timonense]